MGFLRTATATLALVAGCLLVPFAAPAGAAQTVSLSAGFTPYRLGASTTVKLALRIGATDGGPPAPVTRFQMRIPANLELIGSSLGLDVCSPNALLASGVEGCAADAQLGLGEATIELPVAGGAVVEAAGMVAEMGPPVGEDIGVLLYAEAGAPVAAQLVFPGVLAGNGSQSLSTQVPLIPSLPGAPDVSLTRMRLSLGPQGLTYFKTVHGRRVGYRPEGASLPGRCPRGGFRFAARIDFADASSASATSTVACPKAGRRR